MAKSKKEVAAEPSAAEVKQMEAEVRDENRKSLFGAKKVASKIFGTTVPDLDAVCGVKDLLDQGGTPDIVELFFRKAEALGAKYDITGLQEVFTLYGVLAEKKEEAERSLASAADLSKKFGWTDGASIVSVLGILDTEGERAEESIREAIEVAESLFPNAVTPETVFEVHAQLNDLSSLYMDEEDL